jgi:hypothetical protein
MLGHDEMMMKQYLLTKKAWHGPNGKIGLVPKEEGISMMILAFQSREFGFGMDLSEEDIRKVNEARLGNKYKDEKVAIEKQGSPFKKTLTLDNHPFIREFNYGMNKEGYWCALNRTCI